MRVVTEASLDLICRSCHVSKSTDATFMGNVHPLQNRFAPAEYRAYVETPKPPPVVFQDRTPPEAKKILMSDCTRCLRTAIFESTHPFPVFSPLDTIEEYTGTLGDMTFISKPVRWQGGGSLLSNLPYVGAGWYSRVAAEWMLHTGNCEWQHCTHMLNASARPSPPGLPPGGAFPM